MDVRVAHMAVLDAHMGLFYEKTAVFGQKRSFYENSHLAVAFRHRYQPFAANRG
jgi:hypothetical protein